VDADRQTWRRILVAAAVAGVVGVADVGAQGAESPYDGRLAKAVFLSDRVPEALADLAAKAAPPAREALVAAAARAKEPEPALAAPPGPPNPALASRLARRRVLAQGMVALVGTPEARAESVARCGQHPAGLRRPCRSLPSHCRRRSPRPRRRNRASRSRSASRCR